MPGACWSRVDPETMPNPVLRMWSEEMADELGLEVAEGDLLGGNGKATGMDPYAQRYGGHQFGNWAGQLGDGRAITLGEVDTGQGVLELQLKGSGKTPYSASRMAGRFFGHRSESSSVVRRCTTWEFRPPGLYLWSPLGRK